MAASVSTAFAITGSTSLDLSALSSKAAFGSCNVVQGAPMATPTAARVVAIRASSNNNSNAEEARPARREVLAGILAAGAALGFSQPASADVQDAVEEAASSLQRRIDGLFGKDKPYPPRKTMVTGKGPIADAKARVSDFLNKSENPLATNLEKATEETASGLGTATGPNSPSARAGKEFLGQDSTRVDEATARINTGAEKLKGKAVQAIGDAKDAASDVVGAAPDVNLPSVPSVPSVPTPGPGLFKKLTSKVEGVKGDLASKADDAKSLLPGQ